MANKDRNLEYLEGRLNDLEQDYEKVQAQLRTEQDGPTQNKLERQLEQIGRQMDECEKQIQARKQELQEQAVCAALDGLRKILQRHNAQLNEMQQAYQEMVKARSYNGLSNVENVESLIRELLRMPPCTFKFNALEEFKFNALEGFAAWLNEISENSNLIISLQEWGKQHCKNWSDLVEQVKAQKQKIEAQRKDIQSALLIMISYSDEAATQSQDGEVYRVEVLLIENIKQYKDEKAPQGELKGYRKIGLDNKSKLTGDETYSREAIPEILKNFLEQGNVNYKLSRNLEFHIFLPQELLNCDADCWELIKGIKGYISIGHKYNVFVRLHERLSGSYQESEIWKRKWEQKDKFLDKNASTIFKGCDDCDLDDIDGLLCELCDEDEENENMIGLKLIKAPNQDSLTYIAQLILEAGLPLAIWGRANLSESTNEAELNRVLDACILEKLPQTVKDKRRESRRQPLNCHIGHHLSLLWDDPDLVPPKSA